MTDPDADRLADIRARQRRSRIRRKKVDAGLEPVRLRGREHYVEPETADRIERICAKKGTEDGDV